MMQFLSQTGDVIAGITAAIAVFLTLIDKRERDRPNFSVKFAVLQVDEASPGQFKRDDPVLINHGLGPAVNVTAWFAVKSNKNEEVIPLTPLALGDCLPNEAVKISEFNLAVFNILNNVVGLQNIAAFQAPQVFEAKLFVLTQDRAGLYTLDVFRIKLIAHIGQFGKIITTHTLQITPVRKVRREVDGLFARYGRGSLAKRYSQILKLRDEGEEL